MYNTSYKIKAFSAFILIEVNYSLQATSDVQNTLERGITGDPGLSFVNTAPPPPPVELWANYCTAAAAVRTVIWWH